MRTAEKSAPKRGSMKSRTGRGSGWPLPGRPGTGVEVDRAAGAEAGAGARWAEVGTKPAKRALLFETGAGGRLTMRRATWVASCSAASWGLETFSPARDGGTAEVADRMAMAGVCTCTGGVTARCSGARRAWRESGAFMAVPG